MICIQTPFPWAAMVANRVIECANAWRSCLERFSCFVVVVFGQPADPKVNLFLTSNSTTQTANSGETETVEDRRKERACCFHVAAPPWTQSNFDHH